ncbi:hypothetical protein R3P38DRAFT_3047917 [Favolaschia claudopus]|uniref:Phytanoyl-CoA dioxygenase n=1 Tax=Favolaschia claudopus TaxID=2862362 RepID=A0AAW0A5G1_9AGAR
MASNPADLKAKYEEQGFVVIPNLITPENFQSLERACADVVSRTREGSWPYRRTVGKQFPPYDSKDPDSWGLFSQWYCSTPVVNAVQTLLGCQEDQLQMELFNLLINPVSHNFALRWHRDDISGDATQEEEQRALDAWKPAIYDDACLYVVPGSHKIPRTSGQRAHSTGPDAPVNPLDMPGAIRVALRPGESVFYNQNILHCATYDASAPRATLHGCMGNIEGGPLRARNILQHGLNWMKEPQFGEGLDPRGKAMLVRLLQLYNTAGDVGYSLSG